jgi:hypothetical protein
MKSSLLTMTGLAMGMSFAQAQCPDGATPVTRRVVVAWNGLTNNDNYMGNVNSVMRSLSPGADLFLAGIGGTTVAGNQIEIPELNQKLSQAPTQVIQAGPKGFQKIAETIRADFNQAKAAQNTKAEQYEVVIVVTNHGTVFTGPQAPSYGITAMPDPKTGVIQHISQNDLNQFAKKLPTGIRVKMIFGQCYGADSQDTLLKALATQNVCACGAAASAQGTPAAGSFVPGNPSWEGLIPELGQGEGLSLARATWQASSLEPMKTGQVYDESQNFIGENAAYLSSERVVSRYFLQKLNLGNDWQAVEEQADQMWTTANKSSTANLSKDATLKNLLDDSLKARKDSVVATLKAKDWGSVDVSKIALSGFRLAKDDGKNLNDVFDDGNKLYADYKEKHDDYTRNIAKQNEQIDRYNTLVDAFNGAKDVNARQRIQKQMTAANQDLSAAQIAVGGSKKVADTAAQTYQKSVEKLQQLRDRSSQITVNRILARGKLEEVFLREAPVELVAEFKRLRQCELQAFVGAPSATASKDRNTSLKSQNTH